MEVKCLDWRGEGSFKYPMEEIETTNFVEKDEKSWRSADVENILLKEARRLVRAKQSTNGVYWIL